MKRFRLLFIFLQVPLDFIMIVLAFLSAYWLRQHNFLAPEFMYLMPIGEYFKLVLLIAILWVAVFALTGLYAKADLDTGPWRILHKIFIAVSVSLALFIIILFSIKEDFFSRLIAAYAYVLVIALVFIGRLILLTVRRLLVRWGVIQERVIIIGNGDSAKHISDVYSKTQAKVTIVAVDQLKIDDWESQLSSLRPDLIILTADLPTNLTVGLINFCENQGIRFCYLPSLVGLYAINTAIDPVAGYPLIEIKPTPLDGWGKIVKRAFDFGLAVVALILLSPILLLIAILVRLDSPGPALFIQRRPGQFGSHFNLYKFRSMYTHLSTGEKYGGKVAADLQEELKTTRNEGAGLLFKMKDDPRVTKLGHFIRQTSLDELPQLFNVLNGEMSMVGPRPPLTDEVAQYSLSQKRRLLVKPGLTGLWQASGRNETSFDEYLRLDMYYIEHWSLWLDIQIMIKTFWAVINKRGAY